MGASFFAGGLTHSAVKSGIVSNMQGQFDKGVSVGGGEVDAYPLQDYVTNVSVHEGKTIDPYWDKKAAQC